MTKENNYMINATQNNGIIAKKQPPRPRNWMLVSYLPIEAILEYCKLPSVSRYAIIRHDKDVNEDGTPKEPHYHVIVVYTYGRTFTALKKDFEPCKAVYGANTLFEPCDLVWAYNYLTHRDNPEKAQYSPADIICDDVEYWTATGKGEKPNRCFELINDILDNKNPVYLLRKYGRDYVINAQKYYEFANAVMTVNEEEYETIQNARIKAEEERKKLIEEFYNGYDEPPVYDDGYCIGEEFVYWGDEDLYV